MRGGCSNHSLHLEPLSGVRATTVSPAQRSEGRCNRKPYTRGKLGGGGGGQEEVGEHVDVRVEGRRWVVHGVENCISANSDLSKWVLFENFLILIH